MDNRVGVEAKMLTKEITEQLLKSAKSADENLEVFGASEHKYQLNPVIALEKVQQFEEKYGLKLPEAYVKFLTEIGNGGAGPYYGLYSLEQLEICNSENLHQDIAKQAFIDKTMTADMWKEAMDKMDESTDDEEYDALLRNVTTGILIIGTQGCTFDTLLMCSGSETGKIVYIDWNLEQENVPYLTGMTFEDWYMKFFEEVAAKHNIHSYGWRYIESEEDLIRHYYSANTFEEKYKCIVSFLRFKKLSPDTIDFLMHLQEKEMDSIRLNVLLQAKSKEGVSLFKTFLEGENEDAAVLLARLLPKEEKDNFYSPMLKLLHGENNIDKRRLLYYLSDCSSLWAADIVRYASDKTNSEDLRRTAIYVMGQCSDAEKYINEFISFMKEDYWIAHGALQAAIGAKLKSKELDACYKWMAEKYAKDAMMQKNLAQVLK